MSHQTVHLKTLMYCLHVNVKMLKGILPINKHPVHSKGAKKKIHWIVLLAFKCYNPDREQIERI